MFFVQTKLRQSGRTTPTIENADMEFTYHGLVRYGFGFFNPNHAAAMIACLLPLCWSVRVFVKKRELVYLAVAVEIVLYLALIFTYSRAGFIAVLAEGLVFVLLKNYLVHPEHSLRALRIFPNRKIAMTVAILTLAIAVSCGFLVRCVNWISAPDRSVTNRLTLLHGGFKMLADNPSGVGSGMSGLIYTTFYQPVESTLQYRTMVNSFMTFAVENGLMWTCLMMLCFALPVSAAVILIRRHKLSVCKSSWLITGICIISGVIVSGLGSSCFDLNVLGVDSGFIDYPDRIMRILLLACPVITLAVIFGIVVSEKHRLYEHGAILTGLAIVFLLLCVPGVVVSSINNSNGVYQVCSKKSGRWLKYVPPGQIQESNNAIVLGSCAAWDLKKLADFIKKQFPDDNIFIPLGQTSGLPVHGKIILCGKSCRQAKRFSEYEQYWLLPEVPPPEQYPTGLKKIYLSCYDESGYNRLWKSQAEQITILIENVD